MGVSIRGNNYRIDVLIDGKEFTIDSITNVSINQDSTFTRSQYVGQGITEGDQTHEGWSGSLDMEVKSAIAEIIIDAITAGVINGVGAPKVAFVETELYTDGTSASYMYGDVQLKISKTVGGQATKTTKKLDIQAAYRKPV